ncbi:MAG: aminotransferase class V-fold PLP-dependent enzyme [Alphaproteobacteria bacterium]|nr:aminotransferase class V-fold PLP-dependent enzyme [Alphaproteobacteria bacterium]
MSPSDHAPPRLTLASGPGPMPAEALAALSLPLVHHTDPWFQQFYADQSQRLARLLSVPEPPVLVQAEAVVALEAAAASLVAPGDRVINIASGHYGRFFGLWLARHTDRVVTLSVRDDQVPDPRDLALLLQQHPDTTLVSMVHCETPSGTLLPIAELAAVARAAGALVLVDAVASVGGMPVSIAGDGLDVAVLGLHKCLAGPPGLTPVAISPAAWRKMAANPNAPRASILSLLDWQGADDTATPFPFTPSVLEVYALSGVLTAWEAEGTAAMIARHHRVATSTRAAAHHAGLTLFPADPATCCDAVTALRLPVGVDERSLRADIRTRDGLWLAGGEGILKGAVLRIGHIGQGAVAEMAVQAVDAIVAALDRAAPDWRSRPLQVPEQASRQF